MHRDHNVMRVTIDWPVTVIAMLALPRPPANSVVKLSSNCIDMHQGPDNQLRLRLVTVP